jgi:hypothetical protein
MMSWFKKYSRTPDGKAAPVSTATAGEKEHPQVASDALP